MAAVQGKRLKHLEKAQSSLEDDERSGRPVELEDSDLLRELQARPDATTHELGQALGFTLTTIKNRLHTLGYRRVLGRWTRHELTPANRSICQSLLLQPQRKEFIESLVTEDESWILYKNDKRDQLEFSS